MALLAGVHGMATQREWVSDVQDVLPEGLKTVFARLCMNARPSLASSAEALMSLLAFNAQQVRHGGAVTQPAARPIGPGCMDTPAKHTAKLTVLKTTECYTGYGQVTRHARVEDQRGRVHEIEVTGYGWHAIRLIDAATTLPLAVEVGPMDAPETHGNRPSAR
jgi:hypothetical protein